jgi:pimeloyl-ACP methyl ester carboxylesterase
MPAHSLRTTLLGAVCLLLASCGGSDESPAAADPTSTEPTSQVQEIDVGGYRLDIECEGEGSSTVVFEAGSGGDRHAVADWVDLHGATRVCAYDRAGIGTSDQRLASGSTTLGDLADELSHLLEGAGIDEPVVLASHSLGGGIDQFFANRYPERVAGLVFFDSVAIRGFVERLGTFGSIPLFVLTQGFAWDDLGVPKEFRRYFRGVHDDLAARSSNSVHVIAKESGHMIHETVPDLVAAAITEVVEAAMSGGELAPCDDRLAALGGVCA